MMPEVNLNHSAAHPALATQPTATANREVLKRQNKQAQQSFWNELIAFGVPIATLATAVYVMAAKPTPEIKQLFEHNFSALAASSIGKTGTHADSAEEEIRHNYEKMVEAQKARDAEGLVHFISSTTPMTASSDHKSWRDALRRYFEEGQNTSEINGVSPLDIESARALHFEKTPVDEQNPSAEMLVSYQVESSEAFTNYRDTWVDEGGSWKFKTYEKVSEFKKADAEKLIKAAYAKMDGASPDQAATTFASFLGEKYSYITKTGVTIFAPEVKESIEQFVKRHRWSDRKAKRDAGRFEGDGKYIAPRSVLVPLKNNKETTASYQDTWERQAETWRLVQTTVQEQNTQLNELEREKPHLIDAIKRANDADVEAQRTVNTAPLYNAYTGRMLDKEIAAIQELQSKQWYVVLQVQEQRFGRFAVSGDTARVRVVEVWMRQYFSSVTGQSGQPGTESVPQTYHLIKRGADWLVDNITYER